jgi:DNA-binding MarR family transcriptional regulator
MSGVAEAEQVRWLSADEQSAWRAYLRGNRELDVALDRDLQAVGVSLSEYELLSMLSEADEGRLRMSALAALIVQSRSRVTHTAARLERRGWVRRSPAPEDGRGVLLQLTDQGRAAVERFARVHVESVRRHLVDILTPGQFRALGEAMQAVRDAYATDPSTPGTAG